MSFGSSGPSSPPPPQPAPILGEIGPGRQQERARLRRARGSTTLLTRGLLLQEPETFRPQLNTALGG